MKIWIDGCEANVPQRLGSSQIAFHLLKTLEKLDKKNDYTVFLPSQPSEEMPKERPGWHYRKIAVNSFKTWLALPWALYTNREKPDVFFSPTHYAPGFSPVPRVNMIFDLAFLRFPKAFKKRDLWQMKLWTRVSVKGVKKIITISEATKKDIIRFYHVDKSKITVAYPGYDKEIFHSAVGQRSIDEIKQKYNIAGDYALYVGTIQPRKNLIRLIEAFQKIDNLKLIIVGKTKGLGRQGWMYEEILARSAQLGIEDKVIFTGFAPTEDLPVLMSGAKVFVWPSLWEGFGMPPVEAMACGTPVITSNVSSLPEAVGNAGILVDPKSVEQIEQSIRVLAFDVKFRKRKSKEALTQAAKFSWEKMARTVLKTLEEAGVNKLT